jgi:hypothetical protein
MAGPKKYECSLEAPVTLDSRTNIFLRKIYKMSSSEYGDALEKFNEENERFWMPERGEDLKCFTFTILDDGEDS